MSLKSDYNSIHNYRQLVKKNVFIIIMSLGYGKAGILRMNSRQSLYDKQEFYRKGAILKASYCGMRYQVEKWQQEEEEVFRAAVWPEPFCFEKTPEENKEYQFFPFTDEGLDQVYQWLCEKYDAKRDVWEHAGISGITSISTT